jgi:hypothetical protein
MLDCPMCGKLTLHQENKVPDLESATVWCCLDCGHERRPSEPGGNTDPVELKPGPPDVDGGVSLPKPKEENKIKDKNLDKELVNV